jgi:hypothetical protein
VSTAKIELRARWIARWQTNDGGADEALQAHVAQLMAAGAPFEKAAEFGRLWCLTRFVRDTTDAHLADLRRLAALGANRPQQSWTLSRTIKWDRRFRALQAKLSVYARDWLGVGQP